MKLTSTHAELLEQLLQSSGYKILEERIAIREARLRELLERSGTSHDESNEIRGELKGIRYCSRGEVEAIIKNIGGSDE